MVKEKLNYSNSAKLLIGRKVIIGLKGGTNLSGDVDYIDKDIIVLVVAPTSTLDLETKVVHTIVMTSRIDFIQFKTEREVE